ncbi:hypothetical protein [Snodgrassella sp. ESL0253]|uniref:hypothetical protein n=1 Tax=Snodgrassella sp. ESL0253 TaxID=2705031 RepID=UPI001582C430|nr:hypothetical protein [Snodgrassella sp. ESL0253]NUE67744.1 hypothetical protein [Snodgrassella sp. ESL0253]
MSCAAFRIFTFEVLPNLMRNYRTRGCGDNATYIIGWCGQSCADGIQYQSTGIPLRQFFFILRALLRAEIFFFQFIL